MSARKRSRQAPKPYERQKMALRPRQLQNPDIEMTDHSHQRQVFKIQITLILEFLNLALIRHFLTLGQQLEGGSSQKSPGTFLPFERLMGY